MSLQPAFVEIDARDVACRMLISVGFSWGGDATQDIARSDRHAFKDAVLENFKASLEANEGLLDAMRAESHPHNGQCCYRGGVTGGRVQSMLDAAVLAAQQQVRPGRPCSAVLMEH